jgi:hypothetical protein
VTTKSAPASARLRSVVVSTRAARPDPATSLRATSALSSSRVSSMSIKATVAPAKAGMVRTSPTMSFMKIVEPAPMKAMRGACAASVISRLRG